MKRSDVSTFDVLHACFIRDMEVMPWQRIAASTGAPEKVVYAAMRREERRGYLEYGVSLRTAWLTDAGKGKLFDLLPEANPCA